MFCLTTAEQENLVAINGVKDVDTSTHPAGIIEGPSNDGIEKRSLETPGEAVEQNEATDLDTAEALIFRPLFGHRYLLNRRRPYYNFRRRYYRSVDNQNDDLNAAETLVFRPFFRRRFGFARRRFPYYYNYYY